MNKTAVLSVTLLIIFCLIVSPLSFASYTSTRIVTTSGTIVPVRRMVYHGIVLPIMQGTIWNPYKAEDYERFRRWGLNSILWSLWWGDYEKDEMQPEVYDEQALLKLDEQVALARQYGLKVVIESHVSFDQTGGHGWADVLGADYVNLNLVDVSGSRGRERYCKFIAMLAKRYPDCGIDPWGFPYHMQSTLITPEAEATFYNLTQPAFITAIREANQQPIILNPMLQGVYPYRWEEGRVQTGAFVNPNFKTQADPNILYGCNSHDGKGYNEIVSEGKAWNYDYEALNRQWQPAIDFSKTHAVICIETGALIVHSTVSQRPIEQSRLDWLKATLEILKANNINWFYFRYENPPEVQSPIETDGSDTAVARLIAEYAPNA